MILKIGPEKIIKTKQMQNYHGANDGARKMYSLQLSQPKKLNTVFFNREIYKFEICLAQGLSQDFRTTALCYVSSGKPTSVTFFNVIMYDFSINTDTLSWRAPLKASISK